ncbi:hypothetical protein NQ176_g4130 [Zarea fungicola]|uniref:Uncharacterized protein n=1 Tax=Zarea fungicola TaxID=93591 RepID=A0ACC1NF17_9HYPO|nr:hypothetical protein NQ176_g4130 [Lecanicillium fungicola]
MAVLQARKQPLLLITYPRSASNLLVKILSLHEQQEAVSRESGGYFFFPAAASMNQTGLLHRPQAEWSLSDAGELRQKYQACYDELQQLLDEATLQGKMAVTKEHAPFLMSPTAVSDFLHGSVNAGVPWKVDVPQPYRSIPVTPSPAHVNPSVLPDEFLLHCTPAFLIRHPALAFPSYYRLVLSFSDGDMARVEEKMVPYIAIGCTLQWTRQLYDWYAAAWAEQGLASEGPIVLDADDMIQDPAVILRFCSLVGLDQEKVRFHWEPLTEDKQGAVSAVSAKSRATLHSSSGITHGKTFDGLTIEGEAEKWRTEFGEHVGSRIEAWVRAAMPDYTYLVGKKLVTKPQ